jgi:hypothetical protein
MMSTGIVIIPRMDGMCFDSIRRAAGAMGAMAAQFDAYFEPR